MKRIIYREDGGVSVITPAPKSRRMIINRDKMASDINRVREIYMSYYTPDNIKVLMPEGLILRLLEKDEFKTEFLILEPEAEWLKRVFDKATPEGADFEEVDEGINPLPSRRFRNAWSKGIDGVEINLLKAKEQVMAEVRTVRDEELTKTDGLMARANEIGTPTEVDTLKIQRQKLRDLPADIGVKVITDVEKLEKKFPKQLTIDEYLAV